MLKAEPTVFIIDDDAGVRSSLEWLLNSAQLRTETYDSAQAFLDAYNPSKPGCLLLDLSMPDINGLELQDRLAARDCHLPVIIVTGFGNVPSCTQAFKQGAFDFVEKPVNDQVLLERVQLAIEQDERMLQTREYRREYESRMARLTPREREVLDKLLEGRSTKQVATDFGISVQTAAKHRSRVLAKMEVESEAELVQLMFAGLPGRN